MERQRDVQAAFELRGGRSILGIESKGGFFRVQPPRRRLVVFTRVVVIPIATQNCFCGSYGQTDLETIA
jgi:hypothetical protein